DLRRFLYLINVDDLKRSSITQNSLIIPVEMDESYLRKNIKFDIDNLSVIDPKPNEYYLYIRLKGKSDVKDIVSQVLLK
ncbi:MAG: hypothetical protein QXF12_07030, partial [Candidatus Aenigmatarchaeota archaeon]